MVVVAKQRPCRTPWHRRTYEVLRHSGWHQTRRVPVERYERALLEAGGFVMHEAARRFLTEFVGLANDDWWPGPFMPQSPFRIDPLVAQGQQVFFARFSQEAGVDLYPIGLADSGRSYLGMDSSGAVYISGDCVARLADSSHEALENLVMERKTGAVLPFVQVPGSDLLEFPHTPEQDLSSEIGARWSAEADHGLRRVGWLPGRSVSVSEWERVLRDADENYVPHEAARRFLAEFGGLEFDVRGPGWNVGRSPFRIVPTCAKWDYEIFEILSEDAGNYLYPIGEALNRNAYLGMTAEGAVYMGMDDVRYLAESGDQALENLITGTR